MDRLTYSPLCVSYRSEYGLFVGVSLIHVARADISLPFASDDPDTAAANISQSPFVYECLVSRGTPYLLRTEL